MHSPPPLNSSSIQEVNCPPEARGELTDSPFHEPAIGKPESQNLTSESRKPAEGLSRRFVLAGVASATILPAASPVAASAADPVFAVIERYKLLSAAYSEAVNHPHVGAFPKCRRGASIPSLIRRSGRN